jgi:hypothetical protein
MNSLKGSFVSAVTYNSLPHIHDASRVPGDNPTDLEDLRALLAKRGVPKCVSVRLVHKHFDIEDGEVMVINEVAVPSHGKVQVMRPTEIAGVRPLYGVHFFVDADGTLQAYEYSPSEVPDTSNLEPFLVEFCRLVTERGLQHKFGLKLNGDTNLDQSGWTEFEFSEERSTIMIPTGMPTPGGEYEVNVSTEWYAEEPRDEKRCSHSVRNCKHCVHCSHRGHGSKRSGGRRNCNYDTDVHDLNGGGLYFGGQKVELGTPFHSLITAVTEVW